MNNTITQNKKSSALSICNNFINLSSFSSNTSDFSDIEGSSERPSSKCSIGDFSESSSDLTLSMIFYWYNFSIELFAFETNLTSSNFFKCYSVNDFKRESASKYFHLF